MVAEMESHPCEIYSLSQQDRLYAVSWGDFMLTFGHGDQKIQT